MPKTYATPGPRIVKPEIAQDPALARCSMEAQLLFSRLISSADDQGRQIGDPIVVKAACLPRVGHATPRRVDRWLDELAEAELVLRYEADGEAVIQLAGWWNHQQGQRRAYPSRWPAPEGWQDHVSAATGHTNGNGTEAHT